VYVFGDRIVPGATYAVQEINEACDTAREEAYSFPLGVTMSRWGDLVSDCTTSPCGPPDDRIDVVTDVAALVDKFRNLDGAPIKARADLEPGVPDCMVNISDASVAVDAFRGFAYPFAPGPSPCGD
jgi:hypothetical protein